MELSTKWYDLLIAGGLFWLPQIYIFAIFGSSFFNKFDELKTFLTGFSDPLLTLLSTALIALATLLILVTGSLLDLLASGIPSRELPIFYRHLVRNQDWVENALQKYLPYVQKDYDNLRNILNPEGTYTDDSIENLKIWSKKVRGQARLVESGRKKALVAFNRVYMLILVKALSKSGSEKPELLVGPLQSWQLARLLASTLFFLTSEIGFVYILQIYRNVLITLTIEGFVLRLILAIGIYSAVGFFIAAFTDRGFDRVCTVLFSLWYDFETSEDDNKETVTNAVG